MQVPWPVLAADSMIQLRSLEDAFFQYMSSPDSEHVRIAPPLDTRRHQQAREHSRQVGTADDVRARSKKNLRSGAAYFHTTVNIRPRATPSHPDHVLRCTPCASCTHPVDLSLTLAQARSAPHGTSSQRESKCQCPEAVFTPARASATSKKVCSL